MDAITPSADIWALKPQNRTQPPWSAEKIARWRELFESGLSHSKIGAELGITRNASIGKAHRLGLKRAYTPQRNSMSGARHRSGPWDVVGIARSTYQRRKMLGLPLDSPPQAGRAFHIRHKPPQPSPAVDLWPASDCYMLDMPRLEFTELRKTSCRWPLGDGPPYQFCGLKQAPGFSYCGNHCRVAFNYIPATFRRRANAPA